MFSSVSTGYTGGTVESTNDRGLNLNRKYAKFFYIKIQFSGVQILFKFSFFSQYCVQGKCSNTVDCSSYPCLH